MRRFLFSTIHNMAVMIDRERAGREASPTAAVIDNQSVKAPAAKNRGFDANKQRIDISEAMIHIALGALLVRRIAH
jgi:hypothetical protein